MSDETQTGGARVTAVSLVLAAIFLTAGGVKLMGMAAAVHLFDRFGFVRLSMLPIGLTEVVAGALLLVPDGRLLGALGVCLLMVGAAAVHLVTGVAAPMVVANLTLFAAAAWVATKSAASAYTVGVPRPRP
ncbi:MAG: DoxX family protein [Myxococcaceae bacterium]|nr:DoxX family protein [Myxococcaceae bacterium]